MLKYIVLSLFLVSILLSDEYPKYFQQLSTPLYGCKSHILKLSKIKNLDKSAVSYLKYLKEVKDFGYEVDKNDNNQDIKKYLLKLRELQKKYDFFVHKIDENIKLAIDENRYDRFLDLTEYEFNGLMRNRALFAKALEFYKKNKAKKSSKFFDKKLEKIAIENSTTQEFFNLVKSLTYSSSDNKIDKRRKVVISVVDSSGFIRVFVENKNPYSVTMKINATYKNLEYDKSVKNILSLRAGEKKEYIKLYKTVGKISHKYRFKYSWIIGSFDAVHDDKYLYRLPYAKGKRFVVTQGFNGKATHKGHSQYAVDFGMPEGTKVYAARDGVVVKTKDDSNKGGYAKKFASFGNYVTIEHKDLTLATYYHLRKNGVRVNVGDSVKRGDFIGYSGNTGYSSGPHLHFAVFKANRFMKTNTIPICFISKGGIVKIPKRGKRYEAK